MAALSYSGPSPLQAVFLIFTVDDVVDVSSTRARIQVCACGGGFTGVVDITCLG